MAMAVMSRVMFGILTPKKRLAAVMAKRTESAGAKVTEKCRGEIVFKAMPRFF